MFQHVDISNASSNSRCNHRINFYNKRDALATLLLLPMLSGAVFAGDCEPSWSLPIGQPGLSDGVHAVTTFGDDVIAGGNFTHLAGEAVASLQENRGRVSALAFSPDGRWIASASGDGTIALWNWPDFTLHARLAGHTANVASIAFTADGSRLASGSHDSTVRLWDHVEGRLVATLHGHSYLVETLGFTTSGDLLSGSADHTLRIWRSLP